MLRRSEIFLCDWIILLQMWLLNLVSLASDRMRKERFDDWGLARGGLYKKASVWQRQNEDSVF